MRHPLAVAHFVCIACEAELPPYLPADGAGDSDAWDSGAALIALGTR